MTTKKKCDVHVVLRAPGTFVCLNCGDHYDMTMPAPVDLFVACSKAFDQSHRKCKLTERGRACEYCFQFGHVEEDCASTNYHGDWRAWLNGPETGLSSRTLCRKLAGAAYLVESQTPSDPWDFHRCHRLLCAIAGWRERIGEMRDVEGWAPFVDAWDQLEALYLEEYPTGAMPRLFARIQELRVR